MWKGEVRLKDKNNKEKIDNNKNSHSGERISSFKKQSWDGQIR